MSGFPIHTILTASQIDHKELKEVCSRSGRRGSIPYIRLFEEIGDLPISKILVGPSRNQDANVSKVATLLQELVPGREIALEKSEIPFVSTV